MPIDVARINKESVEDTHNRIERGKSKLAAWLDLLNKLEEIKGEEGCELCGAPHCNKSKKCRIRQRKINDLRNQLPFEEFIEMSPLRWYAVVRAKASDSLALTITLKD